MVSAGDNTPFLVRVMQALMLNEGTYKILVAVPQGMKNMVLEEVQDWSIEKLGVFLTVPKDLSSSKSHL